MERTHYTTIRQLCQWIGGIILGVCFTLTSCVNDLDDNTPPDAKSVSLSIKLPQPIAQNVSTRAGATDFNTIKDLNVIIADGENIIGRGYYYFTEQSATENSNPKVTWAADNGTITIHFDQETTALDNLTQKDFYIVANYGKIDESKAKTIAQLKNLKEVSTSTPGVPAGCAMFAKAAPAGMHQHQDGTAGLTMKAELKRTVAMVTVEVDGSKLNKNICLSNFSISLHNVPTECTIGTDNQPTDLKKFSPTGEFKEYQQLAWNPIVGEASKTDCGRETWKSYQQTAGKHYATDPDTIIINPSDKDVDPLFLFENIHAADFGHKEVTKENQQFKRPATVTSTKKEDIEAGSKNCSYIKVRAHYEKIDEHGNSKLSGWVSFKLFLGANVFNDFNVKGNHYYQVTLTLSGNAVTEGGQIDKDGNLKPNPDEATWRVDTDLNHGSFVTDNVDLNASGEYFYIDVVGKGPFWITGDGTFLWIYGKVPQSNTEQWMSAAEGTWVNTVDGKGRILVYAQPAYWEISEKTEKRTSTITLWDKQNGTKLNTMTITQWLWLTRTITPKEYPALEKVFGVKELEIHIDRVDRIARPWGFYGEELHVNNASGFDNTYYLFQENPAEGCKGHREVAAHYLPFGTETRPTHIEGTYNPDEEIIEDGGSAMIYAAMLYLNQQSSTPSESPEQLLARWFPEIKSDDWGYHWYWTIPSLEAWQMIEKLKNTLDPDFPIKEWFPYWSSDAVTKHSPAGTTGQSTGATHSYAYQFGRGLDKLTETSPYPDDLRYDRRDRLRFRLISIQPNAIKK